MGVVEVNSSDSATVPASSGAVREAQGSGVWCWDFRSGNRFAAVADRDGEANIPGLHGRRVVLVPRDRDGTPQSIQDVRTDDASSVAGQRTSILKVTVRGIRRRTRKICQVMGRQREG